MALLYLTNLTSCSAMADAFDSVSHEQLTRMLQGSWSGHRRLDLALRALFSVAGGYLIVDDTVVAKPYARLLGEAAWVWSNKDRKVLFGVSVVLLVWTDGQIRIAQFITYMDPPRFARAMFADGRQGYDCTHISGVALREALPSAP
jgi:hypothetical protein